MILFLCSCPELWRISSAPNEVAALGETGRGGWECGCREMPSKRISECGAEGGGDQVLLRKRAGRLRFSSVAALVAQGITVRVGVISGYPRERNLNTPKESSCHTAL